MLDAGSCACSLAVHLLIVGDCWFMMPACHACTWGPLLGGARCGFGRACATRMQVGLEQPLPGGRGFRRVAGSPRWGPVRAHPGYPWHMPPHLFTHLFTPFALLLVLVRIPDPLVCACVPAFSQLTLSSPPALPCPTTGVPLKRMVAGVAMGLILEPDGRFVVLTDILGSGEWGSASP